MKWKFWITVLAVSLTCGEMSIEDGYFNPTGLVCRNPFCQSMVQNLCDSNIYALITHPLNGTNLFWSIPSITENVTVSVYGTPLSCFYRLNDGDWNTFDVCSEGENASWINSVTMPQGYPVELRINISSSCMEVSNISKFSVFYPRSNISSNSKNKLSFFILMLLIFILARKRKKNKEKLTYINEYDKNHSRGIK